MLLLLSLLRLNVVAAFAAEAECCCCSRPRGVLAGSDWAVLIDHMAQAAVTARYARQTLGCYDARQHMVLAPPVMAMIDGTWCSPLP